MLTFETAPFETEPGAAVEISALDTALWGVLPYIMVVVLVGGLVWRYKYDQFGWTTRSSQLYESKLLRIASPLFHFGLLAVIAGHFFGLVIPMAWTQAVGMTQDFYHFNALFVGGIAGVGTLGGIILLIYRRRTTGPVFMATTTNDKAMYVVLTAAIVFGLWTTLASVFEGEHGHNYRETVAPGSVPCSSSSPMSQPWRQHRSPSICTPWWGWHCSSSGRSPGWCMPSLRPCTTFSGRTSSTAPGMPWPGAAGPR